MSRIYKHVCEQCHNRQTESRNHPRWDPEQKYSQDLMSETTGRKKQHEEQYRENRGRLRQSTLSLIFVNKLADQVPDDYRHQPRYFGLLAPNTRARTSAAVMLLLGQKKRSRPKSPSWRSLIRRCYGKDPLLDSRNQKMYWIRREKPRLQA